jgi:16S rRNA (uracil1498-N3)-methyltransferase
MDDRPAARPPRVIVPDLAAYRESFDEILLRKEEKDHVCSRRLRDGDQVVVLDGKGLRARGRLTRNGTAVTLSSFEEGIGEPANRVTVALACAEPARIEWAIEKGTECGAAGFVLLDADRSQRSHVAALSKRIPRLTRIAEEAVKQCDRTIVPQVVGPKSIEEFLRGLRGETLIVADPSGATIEAGRDRQSPGPGPLVGAAAVAVAIGPEGGFAPAEISTFAEKPAVFLSLGPRILRLETAVVAALVRLVDPA